MSVNRYKPHLLILPEDRANVEILNGFSRGVDVYSQRNMQVLPPAGGWTDVVELFQKTHVSEMRNCPSRFMVLLLDFDEDVNRRDFVRSQVPAELLERVFVLGVLSDPEDLKRSCQASYECIGEALADDCKRDIDTQWNHGLLRHNAVELDRLRKHVRSMLFPPN